MCSGPVKAGISGTVNSISSRFLNGSDGTLSQAVLQAGQQMTLQFFPTVSTNPRPHSYDQLLNGNVLRAKQSYDGH
jgi:hypothetical protein